MWQLSTKSALGEALGILEHVAGGAHHLCRHRREQPRRQLSQGGDTGLGPGRSQVLYFRDTAANPRECGSQPGLLPEPSGWEGGVVSKHIHLWPHLQKLWFQ